MRHLPALAGLAGAAAIVLVLVIATPRLGPGGPSPSPTAEVPPSTITAMGVGSFAARLATGELNGQKLLIVGEVSVEPRRGPLCPLAEDHLCYVGTLAGSSIDLHARPVATVEGDGSPIPVGESSWRSWRVPSAPTGSGRTMAVSVDSAGVVELIGYTPAEEMVIDMSEIHYVDFGAMPLDEIRVVPAWLTGIVAPISCAPPEPGTFISGLPGRYCGNPSWLAPDPARVDPNGYTIPDDWLQVQSNAYLEFAPDPAGADGSAEPRAGLYVIAKRLEGSGCPSNQPPCWQWEVVSRITINGDGGNAQPLATSEPASPSPPLSLGPTASPTQRIVPCPIDPASPEADLAPITSLVDEIGLITNCAAFAGAPESMYVGWSDAIVRNSAPDQLQLIWAATFCDRHANLSLTSAATGRLHFDVHLTDEYTECDSRTGGYLVLDFSAPVSALDVSASLTRASDVPDPNPPPSPFPELIECGAGSGVSFISDTTGLVEGCAPWVPDEGESGVRRGPDSSSVLVSWVHSFCHGGGFVSFDQEADGYRADLGFIVPSIVLPSCPPVALQTGVEIRFTQPMDVGLISATSFGGDALDETPAPSPAASPPPEAQRFECEGAPSGPDSAGIVFEDHTGLVVGCSVPDPVDGDPAVLPSSDPNVLTFTWTIPCVSDVSDTVLSFWARGEPAEVGLDRPYALIAERSAWKPSLGCFTALGARVVQVVFGGPIWKEDIDFVLIKEGRGGDIAEFDWGYFWLTLTSDKLEYAAGEPIEISAELMYDGPSPIALSGVFSLVNGFGIKQLDGPLTMGLGWDEPCMPHEMRAYEPYTVPLQKSASWSPDDPNAAFYRDWASDPVLRLPAGTWLVTAYSDFTVGTGCSGERVELTGSVVLEVR